ncbi:MAG: caspase family protein [Pyrinomonadaceae bacterium]|nr:caspase family protein [Pyrinomonadaceae bacterium]
MPPEEKDYAIVIGINAYSKLPALSAAQSDAADFIEWLLDANGGGLSVNEVKEVKSPETPWSHPTQAKPVQDDIIQKLQEIEIGNGTSPQPKIGRRLYFYFAGHGFGPKAMDVGMLMANAAEPAFMNNLGLFPCREFFRKHYLFDEVIFILDCCRDAGYSTVSTRGFQPLLETEQPMAVPPVEDFIILATPFGEKSFAKFDDKLNKRRGLLTRAVLEAFKGEPRAADGRGNITAFSLRNYVNKRVKELAQDLKTKDEKRQEAEIRDLPNREIIFARVTKKIQVRIIAPDALDGDLIVINGEGDVVEQKTAAQATKNQTPWVIPLLKTAVPYSVKHSVTEMEVILNLGKVEGDTHEFQFPRP